MRHTIRPAFKLPLLLTLVMLLGGCSWFQNEETRAERDAPRLLDTDGSEKRDWFCYGKSEAEWDCRNTREPGLVKKIAPKPPGPFSPLENDPPAPTATPVMPTASAEPNSPAVITGNAIMDAPADYYTVQLIALKDESDVITFARANGIAEPLYTRTLSDGEIYYILLLDVYPTLTEARNAQEEWEATKALKVKPWVRRVGPLQQSARSAAADA